jgi:hypothetical protein
MVRNLCACDVKHINVVDAFDVHPIVRTGQINWRSYEATELVKVCLLASRRAIEAQ